MLSTCESTGEEEPWNARIKSEHINSRPPPTETDLEESNVGVPAKEIDLDEIEIGGSAFRILKENDLTLLGPSRTFSACGFFAPLGDSGRSPSRSFVEDDGRSGHVVLADGTGAEIRASQAEDGAPSMLGNYSYQSCSSGVPIMVGNDSYQSSSSKAIAAHASKSIGHGVNGSVLGLVIPEQAKEENLAADDADTAEEEHEARNSHRSLGSRISIRLSSGSQVSLGSSLSNFYSKYKPFTTNFIFRSVEDMDITRNTKAQLDFTICKRIILETKQHTMRRSVSGVIRRAKTSQTSQGSLSSDKSRGVLASSISWRRKLVIMIRCLFLPPLLTGLAWATWPMQDPLEDPSSWWHFLVLPFPMEVFLNAACAQGVLLAGFSYDFEACIVRNLVTTTIASYLVCCVLWALCVWIWDATFAFDFKPPIPWMGCIMSFVVLDSFVTMLVKQVVPSSARSHSSLNALEKSSFAMTALLAYYALIVAFVHVEGLTQLALIPVWLMIRELLVWYMEWMFPGSEKNIGMLLMFHSGGISLSSLLSAIVVGQFAENATQYCFIALDGLVNFAELMRSLRNLNSDEEARQNRGLVGLIVVTLNETREITVALSYVLGYLAVYFGPNAELMGLVKADVWHFEGSPGLEDVLKDVLFMVAIDIALFILTVVFVKSRYGINMLEIWFFIEFRAGHLMSILTSAAMLALFNLNSLYCGTDMTFKLDWIRD